MSLFSNESSANPTQEQFDRIIAQEVQETAEKIHAELQARQNLPPGMTVARIKRYLGDVLGHAAYKYKQVAWRFEKPVVDNFGNVIELFLVSRIVLNGIVPAVMAFGFGQTAWAIALMNSPAEVWVTAGVLGLGSIKDAATLRMDLRRVWLKKHQMMIREVLETTLIKSNIVDITKNEFESLLKETNSKPMLEQFRKNMSADRIRLELADFKEVMESNGKYHAEFYKTIYKQLRNKPRNHLMTLLAYSLQHPEIMEPLATRFYQRQFSHVPLQTNSVYKQRIAEIEQMKKKLEKSRSVMDLWKNKVNFGEGFVARTVSKIPMSGIPNGTRSGKLYHIFMRQTALATSAMNRLTNLQYIAAEMAMNESSPNPRLEQVYQNRLAEVGKSIETINVVFNEINRLDPEVAKKIFTEDFATWKGTYRKLDAMEKEITRIEGIEKQSLGKEPKRPLFLLYDWCFSKLQDSVHGHLSNPPKVD